MSKKNPFTFPERITPLERSVNVNTSSNKFGGTSSGYAVTHLLTVLLVVAVVFAGGGDDGLSSVDEDDIVTCTDGLDNDGDGVADTLDAECNPFSPYFDGDENDNSTY